MPKMTLDELIGAAGGTQGDQPPCPILIESFDVAIPQTPPVAMLSFLGYTTIAFPVGGRAGTGEPEALNLAATGFTIELTPAEVWAGQGESATTLVSTKPQPGTAERITLSVPDLPEGLVAEFVPESVMPGASSRLTIKAGQAASPATHNLVVTATAASATQGATLTLHVTPFSLSLGPGSGAVKQANTDAEQAAMTLVSAIKLPGIQAGTVVLSAPGLPAGIRCEFVSASVQTGESTVATIYVSKSVPVGTREIAIRGVSQGFTYQATFILTVEPNKLGITIMALRTGGVQGPDDSDYVMKEPVIVTIVQMAMDFDAAQWQTGSVSIGLVTVPTIQLILTSKRLDRDQVEIVNKRIEKSGVDGLPQLPVPALGACLDRWTANVAFTMANMVLPLQVSWHRGEGYDLPLVGEIEASSLLRPPPDRAQEGFSKTFGPLRFSGVGLGIADCKLRITANVELALGPLWLGLYQIGWWVSLDGSLANGPTWSGAGLDFPAWHPPMPYPPLRLCVALARIDQPGMRVSLAGLGLLELKALFALFLTGYFGISTEGWVSAFGFAEVTLPENAVGIPGVIVLKSISGGGGGNSTLRVPTAKDVSSFPLVRRLGLEPGEGEGPPGLIAAIEALNEMAGEGGWITPAQGQYWFAIGAGLSLIGGFVETNALIVAEFGGSSQKVMVIGTATFTFPKTPTPDKKVIGKLILDLAISLQWHPPVIFTLDVAIGDGSFFWDERITPTGGLSVYVQDRDYPLGVAFTLGGYHPQYVPPTRPDYYPVPPRAGFNVQYSPGLTVRGQGYLAVTANAFQLGMSATWLFSLGNKEGALSLEAWLGFYFDILVQWNPFYLDASGGFRAGFAATVKIWFVRVRISVEIALQVQFWTPPFGGRFGAKLWFITIEVPFGAARAGAPPVDWGEFWAMLPEPMSVQPEKGVELQGVVPLPGQRAVARTGTREQPILASAGGFSCLTQAALSVNRITLNGRDFSGTEAPAAIRPMRLRRVDSVHHVTMTRNGTEFDPLGDADPTRRWAVEALRQDVPAAQWGEPINNAMTELTKPATVKNRLAGLRLTTPEPAYSQQSLGPISAEALAVEPVLPDGLIPLRDPVAAGPRAYTDPGSVRVIAQTVQATTPARAAVYAQLLAAGVALAPDANQSLAEYQRRIDNMFTAAPLMSEAR